MKRGLTVRDGKLGRLGHMVSQYLAEGGQLERSKSGLCAEIWPQVVGKWYAGGSRVVGLNGTELKICCDTPALAQQLQYDQEQVIARLNERLGGKFVTSLRTASVGSNRKRDRINLPEEQEPAVGEAELSEVEVPAEEWRQAELEIDLIREERLREKWRRTVQRQARLRQWKARRGYKPCERCGVLHPDLTRLCFACRVAGQDHIYQG